jgi:hypothetical protein
MNQQSMGDREREAVPWTLHLLITMQVYGHVVEGTWKLISTVLNSNLIEQVTWEPIPTLIMLKRFGERKLSILYLYDKVQGQGDWSNETDVKSVTEINLNDVIIMQHCK